MTIPQQLKPLIRQVAPPILLDLVRRLRPRSQAALQAPEWEYIPEGWRYAERHPEVRGWNVADVLQTYKTKWPQFVAKVQGTGPLGIAHESALVESADLASHNTMMSFAYALALAAGGRERVSLLDWGGGIGHYAILARALLPGVGVEYHCKDVPLLAAAGRELLPDDQFYDDERCLERSYDLVLASGSLHFSEEWRELIGRLARATGDYLLVTRMPTVVEADSYVFIQRPYAYGYNTEYLGWCLNRGELVAAAAEAGLVLVRELAIGERPPILNAPEPCQYRGFLFRAAR